ncbi:MAG: hypothetical protein AAB262_03285 [Elusimicrobiota bacterium]
MAKTKKKSPRASPTGTYRYDREKGEVVLVSTDVPKVSSKGKSRAPELPCGRRGPCGGGACPA